MSTAIHTPANLSPEDRRALLKRLRETQTPASRDYPLSWSQERLWLLDRMGMGERGLIMSAALRLRGPLDLAALRRAHAQLAARHGILRTSFHEAGGQAVQRVHGAAPLDVELREVAEVEVGRTVAALTCEPFDLARAPLVRSTLLRLHAEEHVWVVTAHHIVFDGWSVGVFVRDIAAFYEGRVLPPLPLQYAEFAAAQRSAAETEKMAQRVSWWRGRLEGAPPTLELPFDKNRPARMSEDGAVLHFEFDAALAERLRAVCRSSGATLYMGLLAGFADLLRRYSGQTDLVIGTPAANRGAKEREPAIGFFVSTLPLRLDLSGEPSFAELLARVREVTVPAFANQDVPFERIVNELKTVRDASRNPLFQTMFGLRNMQTDFELAGLRATPEPVERDSSLFDLTLLMKETPCGLEGDFEFSTDLFARQTIERMVEHLRTLLEGATREPGVCLNRISVLTAAERLAIDAVEDTPWADVIAEFEAAVRRTPHAAAVVSEEGTLTYAELDRRAGAFAADLLRRGAGPETIVGLDAGRSADTIAGMLGILKAGAAFLPLDPDYPAERLEFMLADAGVKIRIAPCGTSGDALPGVKVSPENAAYVIYTSGSTGKPKGAVISRASLGHFCAAARARYSITNRDRVLQFASLSFDTAIEEILPCLTAGGTLVLRRAATIESAQRLLDSCREWGITVLDLPTSYWRKLTAEMRRGGLRMPECMSTVIIGGEACSREALAAWREVERPGARLLNGYGPTEITVVATVSDLSAGIYEEGREIPIGRPLGAARAFVLDEGGRPVPFGVTGELYIGGPGLARGYLGRPGLTAERFVPDAVSGVAGARLYRTGDRARMRADGQIEFVGRGDHQAKIAGFRVEPGEVEAALHACPEVTEALVALSAEGRLDAFVTVVSGARVEPEALRRSLQVSLPYYMIPAGIYVVERLERLPNGKVDRNRLPAVSRVSAAEDASTDIEARLAEIWKAVLRVEKLGIRDNFFALGGDSIMTIQVASRAIEQGLSVTSRDLFEHQTIADLAAAIERRTEVKGAPVAAGDFEGPARLSPIQAWFFEQNYARPSHFNQSVAVRLTADTDVPRLASALRTVLARHDAFRMRFFKEDGQWMQRLAARVEPDAVRIADEIDTSVQRALDIENGPVIRIEIARGVLFAAAHHLAVDGVSWRVLLEETAAVYAGRPLPAKAQSFLAWPDVLARHAESLGPEDLQRWLRPGRGKALPRDFEADAAANTVASSDRITAALNAEETEELLRGTLSALDARMDEVLLAASAAALMRWTREDDLAVDLESHGRAPLGDFSRTVGWFTSMYPVHLAPAYQEIDAILKNAREALRAVPNLGVDYGALRYLHPDADVRERLAAAPRAEVAFNYLGQFDSSFVAPFAGLADLDHGDAHDPGEPRSHAIEINGMLEGGELKLAWSFSRALHDAETIQDLADSAMDNVRALMVSARGLAARGRRIRGIKL